MGASFAHGQDKFPWLPSSQGRVNRQIHMKLLALLVLLSGLGLAESRPQASLRDVAWLTGRWVGTGLGGQVEDLWSTPAAGAMPGMFRLVKDGAVQFYELMTLVEVEDSLELRLKHFHADLKGWEEKDRVLTFPLSRREGNALVFGGIRFERVQDDQLHVTVSIRQRDGTVKDEVFRFRRATAI